MFCCCRDTFYNIMFNFNKTVSLRKQFQHYRDTFYNITFNFNKTVSLKRVFCVFRDTLYYSLIISFAAAARPAIPWISEGMMILVAWPSAAFWKASRLLSLMTDSSAPASLMTLSP